MVTLDANGDSLLQALPQGHSSFPTTAWCIPKAHPHRAKSSGEWTLVEALKRVEAIDPGQGPGGESCLCQEGLLELTASDPEVGDAAEHLEMDWDGEAR